MTTLHVMALLYVPPGICLGTLAWQSNNNEPPWARACAFLVFGLIWPIFIPAFIAAALRETRNR